MRAFREAPPTAGLPLEWRDFFGRDADFEAAAVRFLGLEDLSLHCSGTAAFMVALETLKRRSGRRAVVIPAYTCPLVPIAIARLGLKIRICDLAPDSLAMESGALGRLCDRDTLAVVPTHFGGRFHDASPAIAIARSAGAAVIEDAAQCFAPRRSAPSADFTFYSLALGKGLFLFEGGMLAAGDPQLAAEAESVAREIARATPLFELRRCLELAASFALYRPALLPLAYGRPRRRDLDKGDPEGAVGDRFGFDPPLHRVGDWRRRVGASAIRRLGDFQAETRIRVEARVAALEALPGLTVLDGGAAGDGFWPFFFVLAPDEASRDRALADLWPSPLGVSRLFVRALPDYAYLRPILPPADAPNARALAARAFTITNSPWLDDRGFDEVLERLSRALKTH